MLEIKSEDIREMEKSGKPSKEYVAATKFDFGSTRVKLIGILGEQHAKFIDGFLNQNRDETNLRKLIFRLLPELDEESRVKLITNEGFCASINYQEFNEIYSGLSQNARLAVLKRRDFISKNYLKKGNNDLIIKLFSSFEDIHMAMDIIKKYNLPIRISENRDAGAVFVADESRKGERLENTGNETINHARRPSYELDSRAIWEAAINQGIKNPELLGKAGQNLDVKSINSEKGR